MDVEESYSIHRLLREQLRCALNAAPKVEQKRILATSSLALVADLILQMSDAGKPKYAGLATKLQRMAQSYRIVWDTSTAAGLAAASEEIVSSRSEVRRGNDPEFGALFVRYLWIHRRPQMEKILRAIDVRWLGLSDSGDGPWIRGRAENLRALVSKLLASPSAPEVKPELLRSEEAGQLSLPRRLPTDVFVVWSKDDPAVPSILEGLRKLDYVAEVLPVDQANVNQSEKYFQDHQDTSHLVALIVTSKFLKKTWKHDEMRRAVRHQLGQRRNLIVLVDGPADAALAAVAPELSGVPALYLVTGAQKVVEGISRAISKAKLGQEGLLNYSDRYEKIDSGKRFLEEQLHMRFSNSVNREGALGIFDIDAMKNINLRFGDSVGDAVLVEIEDMIRASLSRYECDVGRCGDDTFYAAIYGHPLSTVANDLRNVCQVVRDHSWTELAPELWVTCSAGGANYRYAEQGLDVAIRAAIGMIEARKKGGNCMQLGPASLPHSSFVRELRRYFS